MHFRLALYYLTGDTDYEGIVRDFHTLHDEAACPDYTGVANLNIVEDSGIHTDEDIISNPASVTNRRVTDVNLIPDVAVTLWALG
jgi:hypothetical protein